MKIPRISLALIVTVLGAPILTPVVCVAQEAAPAVIAAASLPEAPQPQSAPQSQVSPVGETGRGLADPPSSAPGPGNINGTVTDTNGDIVPGASVILDGPQSSDHRETVANDNAAFAFPDLKPGVPYRVSISVNGFSNWVSSPIVLASGQFFDMTDIKLAVEGGATSVVVNASTEEIAVEQVKLEEQQRILGFIPNFYVVYNRANAAALTTKLKFKLALKVAVDPVTIGGLAFMSGIDQAADRPNFVQGAKGYGQRFGALAADGSADILIGGAILPSLLHQDPRYFYQGHGTTGSRIRHALFSPFVCRGDNGHVQPNYSSLGGNLASNALSYTYYPQSNRGVGLVFGSFAIGTAERAVSGIAQEFIFPRLTPNAKKQLEQ